MWYALATYRDGDGERHALVLENKIFDCERVYRAIHETDPPDWLAGGADCALANWEVASAGLDDLTKAAGQRGDSNGFGEPIPEDRLSVPFHPGRVFAAASNYVEHANEMGTVLATKAESNPYIFMKPDSSVIGPNETVVGPPQTDQLDWEVELGVVIGSNCRRVGVDEAAKYIAGYTVVNDISARDLNVRSDFPFKFDWFQGKCFDTFAPVGPWFVPASCVEDPMSLRLTLSVNDEEMQNGTTKEMIFNIYEQISYLSNILTLRPGDVIATGTPTGVGMSRGIFLKDGDVMKASVESVGTLINTVKIDK